MQTSDDAPRTLYTGFELGFMLGLRPTTSAAVTGARLGLPEVPEDSAELVADAVTAGLRARGKVETTADGHWALGEEAQVVATALTGADRWLGIALSEGEATRRALVVAAGEAVLMLVHDEPGTFAVSAIDGAGDVARTAASISTAFLTDEPERTVTLERTDVSDPERIAAIMLHSDAAGGWQLGHEPLLADGMPSVSPLREQDAEHVIERLWAEGVSAAPGGPTA